MRAFTIDSGLGDPQGSAEGKRASAAPASMRDTAASFGARSASLPLAASGHGASGARPPSPSAPHLTGPRRPFLTLNTAARDGVVAGYPAPWAAAATATAATAPATATTTTSEEPARMIYGTPPHIVIVRGSALAHLLAALKGPATRRRPRGTR
jgi:hypothetical protein